MINQRERLVVCGLKAANALAHHACVVSRFRDSDGKISHSSTPIVSLCGQWLNVVYPHMNAESVFFNVPGANLCPKCHDALVDSKVAAACREGTNQ